MMYSRFEVCDGNLKLSACICRNSAGTIDVLRNGNTATGSAVGRMLNVAGSWVTDTEGRGDDTVGSDRRCQSEEEYRSGEGLGEHLNNEWMELRRMAARSARDRDWEVSVLFKLERESESGDGH
jgi:hypothetical protein